MFLFLDVSLVLLIEFESCSQLMSLCTAPLAQTYQLNRSLLRLQKPPVVVSCEQQQFLCQVKARPGKPFICCNNKLCEKSCRGASTSSGIWSSSNCTSYSLISCTFGGRLAHKSQWGGHLFDEIS